MKKVLFFLCAVLTSIVAFGAEASFYLKDLKIKPGETKQIPVYLSSDLQAKGFQLDITLPEGLTFVDKNIVQGSRLSAAGMMVTPSLRGGANKVLRVLGVYNSDYIASGDDVFFTCNVTASETAALGTSKITITTAKITLYDTSNINLTLPDTEYDIKVYTTYQVTGSSADEEMGVVSGSGEYENGTNATLTATANEGYHFVKWSDDTTENPYTFAVNGAVSLTATFAPNQYTVTFVLGNGEDNVVLTQDYGSALAAPMPVRVGYTFAGWDAEVPATVPLGDKTYTAQWTVNQYTITFDTDGGTAVEAITQDYATDVTAPAAPTKLGYTFAGWSPVVPATMPAENVTVTAQWTINQYTITFDTDGGSAVAPITQDYNTAVTAPASPVKEGYTFSGWSPAVPATMPAENVTVTAQWTINQYTITFVLDNGEANVVLTQDYATAITAPAPEKEGFTFAGWDKTVPATMPAENVTVTAQWTRNSYAVTFIVDGVAVSEGTVDYEGTITAPADPVKEGYTFAGWSPAVPATMPASDQTFTAQWTINQYTMTFVLDNGEANVVLTQDYATAITAPAPEKEGFTFAGWDKTVPATMPAENVTVTAQWTRNSYAVTFIVDGVAVSEGTVDYEGTITAPADPVKEGYTFAGWSPAVAETMPAEDVTYTAQWTVNQYTITFVLGNGEQDVVLTQDYATTLTAPEPARTGFTFAGWDAEVPATVPAANKTFTAQWTRNSYTVKFVVDGETVKEETVDFEGAINAPADPEKEGYTFAGWSPAVAETMPAEDVTYTAQWTVNQYTITFVLGNGEQDVVLTQDYATTLTAPEPARTGFTFAGWDAEVPATVPAANKTFTAQWTRNSYTVKFVVDGETVKEETVDFEGAINAPADPEKEGYTFAGWSPAVAETMPAEDVTYTAQWTVNQYAVIYMVGGTEWARDMVDYGADIQLRSYDAEQGYTFNGWISTDGNEYTTMPAHDVTYTPNITSGIELILMGTGKTSVDVYDVHGRLVGRNMPVAKLQEQLHAGVYIIAGKKIVVK